MKSVLLKYYITTYPVSKKYPTQKLKFIFRLFVFALLFLVFVMASSCKTCKCPAYSDNMNKTTESKTRI